MRSKRNGYLIALATLLLVVVAFYLPVWIDDAEARRNRARVNELISLGQNLGEAQKILRDAGFRLYHDQPVTPTINKDYYQQLVIVGDTRPNAFETIAYTVGLSWMPFTRSESPYVVIDADLDGIITDID